LPLKISREIGNILLKADYPKEKLIYDSLEKLKKRLRQIPKSKLFFG
jgi:hypothetical protein